MKRSFNWERMRDDIRALTRAKIMGCTPCEHDHPWDVRKAVVEVLSAYMQSVLDHDKVINSFSVHVNPDNGPLSEMTFHPERLPGDTVGRRGIVISNDGTGKGIVYDPDQTYDPKIMRITVSMRLPHAIHDHKIEFFERIP